MSISSRVLILILLFAGIASAQVVPGGGSGGLTSVSSLPATCTPGGANAQVNLTVASAGFPAGLYGCAVSPAPANTFLYIGPVTSAYSFFNGYYGLAPQDFGAKGNTKFCYDGNVTGQPTTTFTSTSCAQFSSATDVGKAIEIQGAGAAGAVLHTTIASVTNATTIVLSANATTNVTNVKFLYATDDTSALQSWVSAIIHNPKQVVRAGYVPAGLYYMTQPLRFINPFATSGPGIQECGPLAAGTGNIRCSLQILGEGATSSEFIVATAGTFSWGANTQTAALYAEGWDFSLINYVGVIADLSLHNTSGYTQGCACGLMAFHSTHSYWQQNWVQGFKNTNHNMGGFCDDVGDFESTYSGNAFESNDINAWLGQAAVGFGTSSGVFEKITFDSNFLENPTSSTTGNLVIGSGTGGNSFTIKQFRARNLNIFGTGGMPDILILGSVTIPAGESMVFDSIRQDPINPPSTGFTVNSGVTGLIELNNFSISTGFLGTFGIDNLASGTTINLFGGHINGGLINNVGTIYIYGTAGVGTISGAGGTFAFLPTTTGWSGQGGISGGYVIANQGTAFTNGTIGTLTGWGTGATATACTNPPPGFLQTNCFTITSGSASFAAAPSFIYTPTAGVNGLPSLAAVVCTADVVDITGAGGAIMLKATSQNATTVTFTAKTNTGAAFTPAVTETYTLVLRCGP